MILKRMFRISLQTELFKAHSLLNNEILICDTDLMALICTFIKQGSQQNYVQKLFLVFSISQFLIQCFLSNTSLYDLWLTLNTCIKSILKIQREICKKKFNITIKTITRILRLIRYHCFASFCIVRQCYVSTRVACCEKMYSNTGKQK